MTAPLQPTAFKGFVSYAQNFEDVLLWRALGGVAGGVYVDVGAQHPSIDSVSRAFHERNWRGVHVEPVAAYADELRRERSGDVVLQAIVGSSSQALPFFEIEGTGLSTTSELIAERHRNQGFSVRRTEAPVLSLDVVLDAASPGEIHWLKVDVEGAEADVFASWTGKRRPWVIVVESTEPLGPRSTEHEWEATLVDSGYRFALFDGLNRFYVSDEHPELMDALRSGANIFDDFALSGQASEPFTRLIKHELAAARDLADVIDAERGGLQQSLSRANDELKRLGLLLKASRQDVVHANAKNEAARGELAAVYASTSWRVTAGLRAVRRLQADGKLHPIRIVRGPIVRLARFALTRPAVKAPIMRVLSRFPALLVRVQRLAVRAGLASQMGAFEVARKSTSSHLSNGSLTPKAERVLDELMAAIKEREN